MHSMQQRAVADTAKLTGGTLDYLIANAARLARWDLYGPIGVLYVFPCRSQ